MLVAAGFVHKPDMMKIIDQMWEDEERERQSDDIDAKTDEDEYSDGDGGADEEHVGTPRKCAKNGKSERKYGGSQEL